MWIGGHILSMLSKNNFGLPILQTIANYFPLEALKTIYRSLIESHFRYGNIIWGTCREILMTKLQKILNIEARVNTKSNYDVEAGPLIYDLGWKTVRELIISDTAVIMFKIMHNMAPQYWHYIPYWHFSTT